MKSRNENCIVLVRNKNFTKMPNLESLIRLKNPVNGHHHFKNLTNNIHWDLKFHLLKFTVSKLLIMNIFPKQYNSQIISDLTFIINSSDMYIS